MTEKENVRIVRSARRTVSVEITAGAEVIVRAPARMKAADIQRFLESKSDWIQKHLLLARQRSMKSAAPLTAGELDALKNAAKADMPRRVAYFAAIAGVSVGRITIRCQRKRWGSCSSEGNLNFNCLLMLCPPAVRDYVAAHEVCHSLELNHSPRFWNAVARILPDYAAPRKWLRENGGAIIGRLN